MNAITELKAQYSLGNEIDDVSDLEEYHNAQPLSYYSEPPHQNSLYSSQAMNSSVNLHQYATTSNISLPMNGMNGINVGHSFPKQIINSPTSNAKNFPPTYYTYSQL